MDVRTSLRRPAVEGGQTGLGFGLVALGAALAANSLLGPLAFDAIDYPVSETMRNQTIGLDAANLAVVAPLCMAIGWLAIRGHRLAPLAALGPTAYAAYMAVQYVAGPDHLQYVRALPLQLALFVLGWMLAAEAWRSPGRRGWAVAHSRRHGVAVALMAGFVALRYLPGLAGTVGEEPLPPELRADPAMYWLIFLMDLGLFVPIAVVVAVGLWRRSSWSAPALAGLTAWFLLVTLAVGAMAVVMSVNDDPYASTAQIGLFAALSVLLVAYGAMIVRHLERRSV